VASQLRRRTWTVQAGGQGVDLKSVMRREKAEQLGLSVLAEIGAHGVVSEPDASLQSQPSNAITKALMREALSASDVVLFEIFEAFASVAIQSMRDLGITDVNVNTDPGRQIVRAGRGRPGRRVPGQPGLGLYHRTGLCGQRRAVYVSRQHLPACRFVPDSLRRRITPFVDRRHGWG
jgi:Thiolase, C-terminal domain